MTIPSEMGRKGGQNSLGERGNIENRRRDVLIRLKTIRYVKSGETLITIQVIIRMAAMIVGAEEELVFIVPEKGTDFEDLARSAAAAPASLQLLMVVEVTRHQGQPVDI